LEKQTLKTYKKEKNINPIPNEFFKGTEGVISNDAPFIE